MLRKTLLAATLVSLSCGATHALAQDPVPYLFGNIGKSDADISKSDLDDFWGAGAPGVSSSLDSKDTAWKLGAGVKLNPYFALELQYIDMGEASYRASDGFITAKTKAETDGYGFNAVGTLPLNDLSLYAKAGYHRLTTDVKFSFGGFNLDEESGTEKEWVWSMGVGADYALAQNISVIAEVERYRDVADEFDVDLWSAGVRYSF